MKKNNLCAIGILSVIVADAATAAAAIQPSLVNTYGNNVTLTAGSSTVWARSLSETDFISKTYALVGQQLNQMTWTQNEPNSRPLQFSSYSTTWSPDYAIFHFVAPGGQTFSGGAIQFRGDGIWGGVTFSVRAVASYTTDDKGMVTLGNIYSEDTHATGADWTFSNYNINVPVGQNDFYVVINTTEQWKSYYGNYLSANNIAYAAVPEPKSAAFLIGALPSLLLLVRSKPRLLSW